MRRFLFFGEKKDCVVIRIVPATVAWLTCCHGPSASWPARQTAARKKKPATPVGMTEFGKGKTQERAGPFGETQSEQARPLQR
jgi:hypothetical protein